jgi:glycosyltransferase involved in cell wall biosynthesis
VLHCVERMHTNAIETWLARMHRHALTTGRAVDWWFHVQSQDPGDLEAAYPECAGRVIRSPCTLSEPLRFFWAFRRLCRRMRFDVVHVHADVMSAPYILAARSAGAAATVAQAHNADENLPTSSRVKAALCREPFRLVSLSADKVVGISGHTLETFLGGRARRPGRDLVHYYGVDPAPLAAAVAVADRRRFRAELDLPSDALVLLFGGRLAPEKNPAFVIDVLAALRHLEPRAVAVFAGAGTLEAAIRERAGRRDLGGAVRMIGWRRDLADVMAASDWFILPRPDAPKEGFGLAVVEAQLAGLRLLVSDGVPDDPILPGARVRRLTASANPGLWAEAAVELIREPPPSALRAIEALGRSPMDMEFAVEALLGLHASVAGRRARAPRRKAPPAGRGRRLWA